LSLDVRVSRTGNKADDVTGTAQVDGRTFSVSGPLTSLDVTLQAQTLRAQARAFTPSLSASLTLKDSGGAVASLLLDNGLKVVSVTPPTYDHSAVPRYAMSWSDAQTSQLIGLLRRP